MSGLLREGRAPSELPAVLAAREAAPFAGADRNDPCPCGSGLKFKKCHGGAAARRLHPERPQTRARSAMAMSLGRAMK